MVNDLTGGTAPKFYGTAVIGERGQVVIPAEARRELGFSAGDKLVALGGPHGQVLVLAKADSIAEMMSNMMEHMTKLEKLLDTEDTIAGNEG
ncbi:MAG: AbrB/MazE/SpoVT family DNA-binding domain-containing protein [Chloroflexi bacterium]|jgi:AbrB family looped-hinge helix DNA binding protein|nr:AbrB/MazE/SpoVT family DNA-binding domain-containing protein [Chloroflexota bacterium]MBT7080746.1 AbrB/MazE/SpoVT family DNA-binding domain-containing protein [Chloroflexota bacterium]